MIRKGSVLGVWINFSSATATSRLLNEGVANRSKVIAYTAVTPTIDNSAWQAGDPYQHYIKVYYRGVLPA